MTILRKNLKKLLWLGFVLNCSLSMVVASCSSEDEELQDSTNVDTSDIGDSELSGTFLVTIVAPMGTTPGFMSVIGKINDGPTPSVIMWEETTNEGSCQLLKPRAPFCEEPCGGSAVCVEDNQCQPYPSSVSVGTVTVEGLRTESGEDSFEMEIVANNYQPVGVDLSYPAFEEGDDIAVSALSPVFAIEAKGIGPLKIHNESITIEDSQSVTLTWEPPQQQDISDIHLKLDISHHGGSKGKIECDVEDTGSFEVPGALLDELKALGFSGFPSLIISRKSVGTGPASVGQLELAIVSTVELPVEIPGLISCFDDDDCPEGQICDEDRACRPIG